jgi:hypothetical protein
MVIKQKWAKYMDPYECIIQKYKVAETCSGILWPINSIMHSEMWVNWYTVVWQENKAQYIATVLHSHYTDIDYSDRQTKWTVDSAYTVWQLRSPIEAIKRNTYKIIPSLNIVPTHFHATFTFLIQVIECPRKLFFTYRLQFSHQSLLDRWNSLESPPL